MGPQILLAGPAGGAPGAPMIRERTIDGEPILSIDTMEEFSQAVATGQPIEMPWALARSLSAAPILPRRRWTRSRRSRPRPKIPVSGDRDVLVEQAQGP